MPVDILGTLTPGLTIPLLASGSGTGIDLGAGGSAPAGTALYGLVARILVSTASNATGSNTLTFTIDHSSDNATWKTLAGAAPGGKEHLTLSPNGQGRGIFSQLFTSQAFITATATDR